jgi:hypothetical protein
MSFVIYLVGLSFAISYLLISSTKTSSLVKILGIIFLVHGYITSISTLEQVSGYPSTANMPHKFDILYARVLENNDNPFIEIWASHKMNYTNKFFAWFALGGEIHNLSRVYRIPYTEENHEMVLSIQKKLLEGEKVGIIQEQGSGSNVDLRDGLVNYKIKNSGYLIQKRNGND